MNLKNLKYYMFAGMMAMVSLTSCSEDTDEDTTYANWQERNVKAFNDTLKMARSNTADWKVLLKYSYVGQTSSSSNKLVYNDEDYIAARVLKSGTDTMHVMSTDSVVVHYAGYLINGHCFNKSWTGKFSELTARPSKNSVLGFIDGFSTALLSMHKGDEWEVYIPYSLAYGASDQGTKGTSAYIPAYSTLKFNIKLVGIFRAGQKVYIK